MESSTGQPAESLAFSSLLLEGFHVRLSGQDVERGTFNQRHAVLIDRRTSFEGNERIHKPWTNLQADANRMREDYLESPSSSTLVENGVMEVCNSPLSEEGVLAFEHGYSLLSDQFLVLWEAQFGDFANCAQTVIDTFIASGGSRWGRTSGLVMLLPHGYEGQGPDHSSANVARFLSLVDEKATNVEIAHPTTPSNFFHLLRRQARRNVDPKMESSPLIIFTPKSKLHHSRCRSSLEDLGEGKSFSPILVDVAVDRTDVVLVCSGKVYYDVLKRFKTSDLPHIVRIEQLSPFPRQEFAEALRDLRGSTQNDVAIRYLEEEASNLGAFDRVREFFTSAVDEAGFDSSRVERVGRRAAAAAATGSFSQHVAEQTSLVDRATRVV